MTLVLSQRSGVFTLTSNLFSIMLPNSSLIFSFVEPKIISLTYTYARFRSIALLLKNRVLSIAPIL